MIRLRANKYELISTELIILFGIHAIFLIAMSFWLQSNGHSLFKEHRVIVSIAVFFGCVFFVGSLILAEVYRRATQDPAQRRLIRGISASLDAVAIISASLYLIATYIPTKKWWAPLILISILCVSYILVRVFRPPAATEGGES